MIDARLWTRPSAKEIHSMIQGMRNERSLDKTVEDIGARLGRSKRRVYYWMSPKEGRAIDFCEWLALQELQRGYTEAAILP